MKTSEPLHRRARRIVRLLAKQYPDAHCALHYDNPLQLLIATIPSAQCTDVRELEIAIQSTGFFRNKARNIIACCQQIVEQHGGQAPRTMEELVQLPGIGRNPASRSYCPFAKVLPSHSLRTRGDLRFRPSSWSPDP